MPQKILLRRDTAAAWTAWNPVLELGEVGVETDTLKFKIGTGSAAWTALSYVVGSVGDATSGSKGAVQLAGDLGGTAAAPTVPGLASKANDSTVVHNVGAETIAGTKTFSSLPVIPTTTPSAAGHVVNKQYADASVAAVLAAGTPGLTRTSVKTTAYTAVPGDLIPVDVTANPVSITLPAAPADRTRIAVKMIAQNTVAPLNTVTVQVGGADVFNKANGSTAATLSLVDQASIYTYTAASGIWTKESGDLPLTPLLSSLSAAYAPGGTAGNAPTASPSFTGTPSAPTAAAGTNTTQIANTAYVTAAVAAMNAPINGGNAGSTYTGSPIDGGHA